MCKIYLDNCCYNRPFDMQSQLKIHLETQAKLYIQQRVKEGKDILVWSYILEYENAKNPYKEKKETILAWKNVASECVSENEPILLLAEALAVKGIKLYDALHIACAVNSNCDYYITTDKKLLNTLIPEIKILNPIDYVRLIEG